MFTVHFPVTDIWLLLTDNIYLVMSDIPSLFKPWHQTWIPRSCDMIISECGSSWSKDHWIRRNNLHTPNTYNWWCIGQNNKNNCPIWKKKISVAHSNLEIILYNHYKGSVPMALRLSYLVNPLHFYFVSLKFRYVLISFSFLLVY